MNRSYIFFDIECANCFDGIGKMCSFGYVLVDDNWNILDEDDLVMNPETEFDWYLFDPKKNCQLAYSKDYFRAQRNFESFYSPIKKLMETSSRRIIGFGVSNDIGFLYSACERYSLPQINYAAYDLANILKKSIGAVHKLEDFCHLLKVDISDLKAHKSQDDAKMTMRLMKFFCEEQCGSIEELLENNKDCKISVERYVEQMEINRHNKEVHEKLKEMYGKKIRAVLSHKLSGDYALGFKISTNPDLALKVGTLVQKHDGILKKNLKSNGTIIIDDKSDENLIISLQKRGLKSISVSDFLEKTKME